MTLQRWPCTFQYTALHCTSLYSCNTLHCTVLNWHCTTLLHRNYKLSPSPTCTSIFLIHIHLSSLHFTSPPLCHSLHLHFFSMGIPMLTVGIRRYTNTDNRGFAFGLFYSVMNIAAFVSGKPRIIIIEVQCGELILY
jgi:hypothetical protein